MFWIPFSILMLVIGFVLFFLTKVVPLLQLIFFDWIAMIFLVLPIMLLLYQLYDNRLIWFLEKVPRSKLLMFFLRRDGEIVPVLGSRAFPGESFIDVPRLGLVHDLGKATVYKLGKNTVRFVLENVNHTANVKYANFTGWLYHMGFNNIRELQATVAGQFPEKKEEVEERLQQQSPLPVVKLVEDIEKVVEPVEFKAETIHDDAAQYLYSIPSDKPTSVGKQFMQTMKKKKEGGGKWWN